MVSTKSEQWFIETFKGSEDESLYRSGLSRSFLTTWSMALTYVLSTTTLFDKEMWSRFKRAGLSQEIERVYYETMGRYPYGSVSR